MRMKHSGLYKLEASSTSGTTYKKFTVSVYESPSVITVGEVEIKGVSVKEGESLTLQTDVLQPHDELIVWRFGDEGKLIAKADLEAKKNSYDDTDERFSDRLKLDQTGSLTINNIRNTDSGLYIVKISSSKQTSHKRFIVTVIVSEPVLMLPVGVVVVLLLLLLVVVVVVVVVLVVFRPSICGLEDKMSSTEPETVECMEGDFAFLSSGVTEMREGVRILWTFKDEKSPIATMSKKEKTTYFYDNRKFRGRLQLDYQTGSLIIRNFRKTDTGVYQLEIKSEGGISCRKYKVDLCGEVITMPVKEGHDVTLKFDYNLQNAFTVQWFRDQQCIATLDVLKSVSTKNGPGGKFKDRLKLDDKTGFLTIRNIRPEHTGLYQLRLETFYDMLMNFNVILDDFTEALGNESVDLMSRVQRSLVLPGIKRGEETDEMKTVLMKEGETLKLFTNTEIETDDEILLMFGILLKQRFPYDVIARYSKQTEDDKFIFANSKFDDNLKLDDSGSLTVTITNAKYEHCGDYYLQITNKRKKSFKSFTFIVGAFGDTDEVKSVTVMVGKSVTLKPDGINMQTKDSKIWTFGHDCMTIVHHNDQRFRGHLHLDQKNGSLTIRQITANFAGRYQIHVISGRRIHIQKFNVTVQHAVEVESMSVKEGDSVTLRTGLTDIQKDGRIEWRFGNQKISATDNRLHQDKKTGSLTIRNTTTEDAGYYEIRVTSSKMTIIKGFNVDILDCSPNPLDNSATIQMPSDDTLPGMNELEKLLSTQADGVNDQVELFAMR